MKTYQIIVTGRVQAVGYRNYVKRLAQKHQILGSVVNRSDGSVLIIAQATKAKLDIFIKAIQIPQHPWMRIDEVELTSIDLQKNYSDFRINY